MPSQSEPGDFVSDHHYLGGPKFTEHSDPAWFGQRFDQSFG